MSVFPKVIPIDPLDGATNVSVSTNICFDITDPNVVDLTGLLVTVNGIDAIVDGYFVSPFDGVDGYIEVDGYFLGDGYDGYVTHRFCIDPENDLDFDDIVDVEVHVANFLGIEVERNYSFTTERETALPEFDNIFPSINSIDVPTDTAIRFSFNDPGGSGANLSTLEVRILGSLVVIDGNALDGYELEATPNDQDGYDIQLFLLSDLPEFTDIDIVLTGDDHNSNFVELKYSWKTADETGPVFENLNPVFPDSKISVSDPIFADILDFGSGVDSNTVGVTVDGTSVIDTGIVQPGGFVVELIEIEDGYRLYVQSIGPVPHDIDVDTAALWRMNSVTSAIPNATGDSVLDGVLIGGTSVSGKFGNAIRFTSSSDRIVVPTNAALRLQDFTIEAWIRPLSLTGDHTIYTYEPTQTITRSRGALFKITSSGALAISLGNGVNPFTTVSTASGLVSTGTFTHVAAIVSRSDNLIHLLVDGVVRATAPFPFAEIEYDDSTIGGSPPTGGVFIGNRINPFNGAFTDQFLGDIDDVRIADVGRTISSVVNSFNRGQSVTFAEFSSIDINIFAQDKSGNDGYISYFFNTLDETAPEFSNFDPSVGSSGIDPLANIIFDFTDEHSGPDLNSLNVTVDNTLVISGGVALGDTSFTISNITDGYTVDIDLGFPLPEFKAIVVTLDGYDIDPNQTIFEYQFSTDDITEPRLVNEIPPDGSTDVSPFTTIEFDIHDTNGSGLLLSTVNVQVDDIDAVIGGEEQEGWDLSVSAAIIDGYDGYNFVLSFDDRFNLASDIRVLVDGYDAYGNQFESDYAFTTHIDLIPPEIVSLDPLPFDTGVSLDSNIIFEIVDGYDVDLSRLNVHVDNQPAVIGGVFQSGFIGDSSGITEIEDGYIVDIDPETNFVYNQQVTVVIDGYDFSDNHVNFEYFFNTIADVIGPKISNRIPGIGAVEVDLDDDIEFIISDSIVGVNINALDVHLDGSAAIINGEFQSGWNGPSSGIEFLDAYDGYHVVIDPQGSNQFDFNQVLIVTIDGYDFADNHTLDIYSFSTISDVISPTLSNLSPAPDEEEVAVNTDIVFDITDEASGVDLSRLDVVVADIPAMVGGEITSSFNDSNSGITQITDGYRITLDSFIDFGFNELNIVTIDGYDVAGNQTNLVYSFRTKIDVNGPTITPVDPPAGVGDISRDTDITIRITDTETGVNFDTVDITIDNSLSMEDGEFVTGSGFDGALSTVTPIIDGYEIFFDSTITFDPSFEVRVVVDGYDNVNNQTHFEYVFTTIDDVPPEVFDFTPTPNSVGAASAPVNVSFGVRDVGGGEVDLRTLTVEVSEEADGPFITIYEPSDEFQNGWSGVVDNLPGGDGYSVDATRNNTGASLALYTVRVTAQDHHGNTSITTVGKTGGLVDSGTGTVTGDFTLEVGEFFLNSNQIEAGDLAIVGSQGLVVDGYTSTEIVFDRKIASSGTPDFRILRGTFLLEGTIFRPLLAEATAPKEVDVTFSDPPVLTGNVLSTAGYAISGGDYPVNVVSVTQLDDDTFTLTSDVPMQPLVEYTLTVDTDNIFNEFGLTISDGYESIQFTGFPDAVGPRVLSASNEPFNINITVVFNEFMTQNSALTNPNNYILSNGAFVIGVVADPKELDRVVLTAENLSGSSSFDVFVNEEVKDAFGNALNKEFNHAVVSLELTGAALSGLTGKLKTRNAVLRLHEDSDNWYIATEGGLDVVSKLDLSNEGFVLDGYGFNAVTSIGNNIYFGANDGYQVDAYGVHGLSFDNLSGNSTLRVFNAFSDATGPAILSNEVNDLFSITNADDELVVVGTVEGATLIKNSESAANFSVGDEILSVQMDDAGETLYLANISAQRIEVFYNANLDVGDGYVDAYYDIDTSPEISDSTINQIKVTSDTSVMDAASSTIYVATDDGLSVIHTDESVPGSSESGGLTLTYGIEGSGATFEILGGDVNRVVAVDVNLELSQIFVATDDPSHKGGLTIINIPSNTRFQFASDEQGTLVNNDLRDVAFKNL